MTESASSSLTQETLDQLQRLRISVLAFQNVVAPLPANEHSNAHNEQFNQLRLEAKTLLKEPDFDKRTLNVLRQKGHDVIKVPKIAGGMNGVLVGDDGFMYGGACWRADGTPIGISGGEASPKALISTFQV